MTTGGVTTASDPTLSGQVDTSGANFTARPSSSRCPENDSDVIGSTSVNYLGQFTFVPTTLSPSATPVTVYAQIVPVRRHHENPIGIPGG